MQAAMNGDAVEPDRAGAAVAGVAAFFDSEPSHLAQESSQALARPWLFRERLAVDEVTHSLPLIREFAPDLFGEIESHVLAILRRSMNVVKELRNFTLDPGAQIVRVGKFRKLEPMRPFGRSGNRQHEDSILRIQRADQQRGRAPEVSQRYSAEAGSLAQRRGRQVDTSQQIARLQHILIVAGDEILDRHPALAAIALQDPANALERDCQRNHRTRR